MEHTQQTIYGQPQLCRHVDSEKCQLPILKSDDYLILQQTKTSVQRFAAAKSYPFSDLVAIGLLS